MPFITFQIAFYYNAIAKKLSVIAAALVWRVISALMYKVFFFFCFIHFTFVCVSTSTAIAKNSFQGSFFTALKSL